MAFDTAWRILGHVADTEDVVQDALLAAVCVHQKQAVVNWGGLLRQLTTQRAIDRLRERAKSRSEPSPADSRPLSSDEPEPNAIARELAVRLRHAVSELPDREGTVFSLRYFGEMANEEISRTLEISPDAVGVALHKARQKLKERLAEAVPSAEGFKNVGRKHER
jgi:RNA polymerase sigma-70 factor (ECF subfamily)